jgi:hypothetical protein
LSDGADNSGGIDLETLSEVKRYRIPVHTVGFGKESPSRDVELVEAQVPVRALAESKLAAQVTLRSFGYENRKARITLKDNNKTLATREVTLKGDGREQTEPLIFRRWKRRYEDSADHSGADRRRRERQEQQPHTSVAGRGVRPRILYIEGEPKWEFKFLRRAIEADQSLQLVSDGPHHAEQGVPPRYLNAERTRAGLPGNLSTNSSGTRASSSAASKRTISRRPNWSC